MTENLPDPVDVHVGSRVRMRRLMMGLSQDKLADIIGLTFQQIQKYEKGANRIGASRLFQLSNALGVKVQYFYDDLDGEPSAKNAQSSADIMDTLTTPDGMQLCKHYAEIRDHQVKRKLLELVRTLAESQGADKID